MEFCGKSQRLVKNEKGELVVESNRSVFDVPLNAKFRTLTWYGAGTGVDLTPGFNLADILGREIVLKSFRIIPYAAVEMVDLFLTDGVTDQEEFIPVNARIDRVFDVYPDSCSVNSILNGVPLGIFSQVGTAGYFPVDLYLDNIFHWYPEKVTSWTINITANVFLDINAATEGNPNVKVLVECYLL